jgi:phage gp46-like protein
MDCPSIFAEDGDCETVSHDLRSTAGGLDEGADRALSAILIQLNTDKHFLGERGWWGDQFQDFEIGNHLWRALGSGGVDSTAVLIEEYIRDALNPLIDQDVIDDIRVRVVRVVGGFEAQVDALRNGTSIFRTVING